MSIQVMKKAPETPDAEKCDFSGEGPWYVVDPDAVAPTKLAKHGIASTEKTPETTLIDYMRRAAQSKGDKPALEVERGPDGLPPALDAEGKVPAPFPREKWTKWTFKDYHNDTRAAAKGFMKYGFPEFGTVNVWGFNAPEWNIAAFSGMYAGGKVGGIYPTDTPEIVAYKIIHSGGSVICVDDQAKAEKIVSALNKFEGEGKCKQLKLIVSWAYEPAPDTFLEVDGIDPVPFISWKKLLEVGKEVSDEDLDARANAVLPQHCAVLVYTSGTTGDPKAVMLSHDNIIYAGINLGSMVADSTGFMKTGENRMMTYLPLSHVAGTMNDLCVTLIGSVFYSGYATVMAARVYDIKKGSIGARIKSILPSAFFAVPLVYEKIADKARQAAASVTGIQKTIAGYGKDMNLTYARNIQIGMPGATPCCKGVIGDFVANKARTTIGFDQCKYWLTGAAPIRVDTLEFFSGLGIYINEAYGMSETSAVASASTDQAHSWGSCGFELPGCETKVYRVDTKDMNLKTECPRAPSTTETDEKYQGELCFRGRHVMMGYLACPDFGEEHRAKLITKTAETIDATGWLHSGDKGLKTVLGMIKITGRYKELIIGAGGENIAPVPIEDNVKKLVGAINEVMMVGDQRKYNVAIITLKAVGANGETPGTDELEPSGKLVNPAVAKISEAIHDKKWEEVITKAITDTNNNNKVCLNNTFKIQKYTILPTNFSEENGELTPTKKLKRKAAEKMYNHVIEHMYKTDGVVYVPYVAE